MSEDKVTFDLGDRYQEKVIANLIYDEPFTDSIIDILHEDYFDKAKFKWIVSKIKDHYNEYYTVPTYESLLIQLRKDFDPSDDAMKKEMENILLFLAKIFNKKFHRQLLLKDKEVIQNECRFFCKKQEFKNAVYESSIYIRDGQLENAQSRMEKAFLTGRIKKDGIDFDDIEDRKNTDVREGIIPLPWSSVNKELGGGVGKGECMVIIAPTGAGKTTVGCNIAIGARRENYTAVFYSLELSKKYIRHKMDAIMLKMDSDELIKLKRETPELYGELVQKGLDQMPEGGNLIIQRFPSGITATDINQDLKILRTKGYDPQLILIDYMDLMDTVDKEHRSKKDWEKFEFITRDCKDKIAFENDIAVIGFMQGNTDSLDQTVITHRSTSGGAKRLHPADGVFGYGRNSRNKNDNRASWSFLKSRVGRDGFYFPVTTDYEIGMIEVHANKIPIGDEEESREEDAKKNIAERYKKFNESQKAHNPDVLEDYIKD